MFLKYFGLKRICLVIGIMANLASICDSISDGSSDISDFGGFTEQDLETNISVVPDSDPGSSDIEVSSVGSSGISDLGETEDENVNVDADVIEEVAWTSDFRDVTINPFNQHSGPNLPENFDTATAKPIDYFELLFKTEMFADIVTHTNDYALFKRDEIRV